MNVLVPYTAIHPATYAATVGARRVYVGSDDEAYWRLLRDTWWQRRSTIIVEHDVVPPPGGLAEMAACPCDWCAFAYRCGDIWTTALGCTKFGAPLMTRNPDIVSRVVPGQRGWNGLDGVVIGELHRRGEHEHVHEPRAIHHHDDTTTRRITMTKLKYVGDGSRYLHEDYFAGIPPIPPTDWETDNETAIAVCLESGLYLEDTSGDTKAEKAQARADVKDAATDAKNAVREATDAEAVAAAEADRAAIEREAAERAVGHYPA